MNWCVVLLSIFTHCLYFENTAQLAKTELSDTTHQKV